MKETMIFASTVSFISPIKYEDKNPFQHRKFLTTLKNHSPERNHDVD